MEYWTTRRTIKAASVGLAVYIAVALYLKYTHVPLPPAQFERFGSSNISFIATKFGLDDVADTPDNPTRSPVILLEDGKELGPPHGAHEEIRDLGRGRYSHWQGVGIVFSASDNTNPNSNGRKYAIETQQFARYASSNISFLATKFGLDDVADAPDNPTRSPVILLEDGKELGPPHSAHEDIRNLGRGRFSHWQGTGIIFSASDNSNPNKNGRTYTIKTQQFAQFGSSNVSFLATNFGLDDIADTPDNPIRSPVILLEDGKELGPPHSAHEDIRNLGRGRFSHWQGTGIIFSASDNTNPNTNGRKYTIRTQQ